MPGRRIGIQARIHPATVRGVAPVGMQLGLAAGSPAFVNTFHSGNFSGYAHAAAVAGAKILRFDYSSGAGTAFASLAAACRTEGIDVLPILIMRFDKTVATTESEALDLGNRYPWIRKVEFGNEVNRSNGWGTTADPTAYVDRVKAASNILRGNNSNLKLCSAGLSQGGGLGSAQTFLSDIITAGIDPYIDAYGVHAYEPFGRDTFVPGLRSTMTGAGITKPMWVTEGGADPPTSDGPFSTGISYSAYATAITTHFSTLSGYAYVDDIYFYSVADHDTSGGASNQDHFGLYQTDLTTAKGSCVTTFQSAMATYG